MRNVVIKKYIFEIFNTDTYICSVVAANLNDAIKQAKKKVSFDPLVIDTGHQLN